MKKIKIKKPLTICFVDAGSTTIAEIVNPPANFVIPRIGEHFEFSEDGRTNVVTSVYHDYFDNEITIFYDFFMCYENKQIKHTNFDDTKVPDDKFD
jgi:hypothetical protein